MKLTPQPQEGETSHRVLCVFNSEGFECEVWQFFPTLRIEFFADGDIDIDGAYRAYHPDSAKGLDNLANAGHPGNWFGVVTSNGKRDGRPVIQVEGDPAPGFFVSSTAYQWPEFNRTDPRRYLDAEKIRFIVIEDYIRRRAKGVVLGCRARVTNIRNEKVSEGMTGDMGPLKKIGELTPPMAEDLGLNSSARSGGTDDQILKYEIFPDVPAVLDGVTYPLIRALPETLAA